MMGATSQKPGEAKASSTTSVRLQRHSLAQNEGPTSTTPPTLLRLPRIQLQRHSVADCDREYEICNDGCRSIPPRNKWRRRLCWVACIEEYARCLASSNETLTFAALVALIVAAAATGPVAIGAAAAAVILIGLGITGSDGTSSSKTEASLAGDASDASLAAIADSGDESENELSPISSTNANLQTKLTVNQPGDKYEQEADRVAEQVMRMPEPQLRRQCSCGKSAAESECPECKKNKKEAEGSVQRVATSSLGGTTAPPIVGSVLNSPGSPLPTESRFFMESRFGRDFSQVRVHTDSRAAESAAAVQAKAYTVGNSVVFGRGQDPSSDPKLLAHELTHVLQQSTSPARSIVQRFESKEHMEIADDATRGAQGEVRSVELAPDYRLTYGEMVAMAGDFFGNLQQMRDFANAKSVKGAGTREELEYVRIVKVHGREDREKEFSEGARKAVDARYYGLAANNRSHFLNPKTGDTEKAIGDKAEDSVGQGEAARPSGAPGYYRRYHRQAIREAVQAGQAKQSIDAALAVEAFGGHYLTDMFAAGHTRTPRGSISEYWNAKVPMFFHNFKGFLAEKLANHINDHNVRGVATVPYLFEQVLTKLNQKLTEKGMPDFQFGDLVAGSVHDYDNKHGVKVTIAGKEKTLYGDASLNVNAPGGNDTKQSAMNAVRAGVKDVEFAYAQGQGGTNAATVLSTLRTNGLFAPETLLPTVVPDANLPDQSLRNTAWEFQDAHELLQDPRFQEALKLFLKEKSSELARIGESLEEAYQREAFAQGVIPELDKSPVQSIVDVVNWTPNLGEGLSRDRDAKAREYVGTAKQAKASATLTYHQRRKLLADLLDGPTVGNDEDAAMEILKSASAADARRLIKEFGWKRLYDEIDDGPGEEFAEAFPKQAYQ